MYVVYADGSPIYSPILSEIGYILTDAKVTMELNKAGSFSFTIPSKHPNYYDIRKLKTIIRIEDDGEEIWRGRVLDEKKDFFNNKIFNCEGVLGFLNDVQHEPYEYSDSSLEDVFKELISMYAWNSSDYRKIYPVTIQNLSDEQKKISLSSEEYSDTLTILNSILGATGGYVIPSYNPEEDSFNRGISLNFYGNLDDRISDQTIRFGTNLLDFEEFLNATDIYTYLIPLGKKNKKGTARKDITSVNSDQNYIFSEEGEKLYGKIWKTIIWEEIDSASTLLSNGKKELNEAIKLATTINIKAVDLRRIGVDCSRINLGYNVPIVSIPHEVNANFLVSKITLNLLDPSQDEYTLGFENKSLTEQQVATSKIVNSTTLSNYDYSSITDQEIADLDKRLTILEGAQNTDGEYS